MTSGGADDGIALISKEEDLSPESRFVVIACFIASLLSCKPNTPVLIIQIIVDQFGDTVLHLYIVKSQIYNALLNSPEKLPLDDFIRFFWHFFFKEQ